jgi:hypothetical protein
MPGADETQMQEEIGLMYIGFFGSQLPWCISPHNGTNSVSGKAFF